jgi:tetratricopeptide (TPR) repeat protein
MGNDQNNEAIAMANKMVTDYPDSKYAYFMLGLGYMGMDSNVEAIAAFKKGINMGPTFWNLHLCAVSLSNVGRHEEAIEMANKAINLGRNQSQEHQNSLLSQLAEYYRRAGRYEEAIDTSRKLLDSNPDNKYALRAYITMTCAYNKLGSEGDTRSAAEEVLRINPNFSMEVLTTKDSRFGMSFYDWFLKDETDKNLLINALRKAGLK